MTVPTRTALELPRTGLGEALGVGLQQGSQLGLQNLLKNFTLAQAARKKEYEPLTGSEFNQLMKRGDIGRNYPGELQFQVKEKLDRRISQIGRRAAEEEFGRNPLDYLKGPQEMLAPTEVTPEQAAQKETFKKMGIDPEKSAFQQVKDYLLGRTKHQEEVGKAFKKKPWERLFAPIRETLSYIEQSLGGGASGLKVPTLKDGKLTMPKTAAEAWQDYAEKGLTPEESDALRRYGFEGMVAIDVIGALMKTAPQKGLKMAEDMIKSKKYPTNVLREIKDITKEYKGKVTPERIPKKEMAPKFQEKLIEARKAKAKELAGRPLPEYLKEKKPYEPPSVKAAKTKAADSLKGVEEQISTAKSNIGKIDKELERGVPKKEFRGALERSKSNFESQLKTLEKKKKDLQYVAKRGREPFSYEKTLQEANAHNKKIKFAYENPQSVEASKIIREFNRDQKYVQEAMNILKRRPNAPIAPYKDLYTNKLKTYNDSYREMIKNLQAEADAAKGAAKKNLEGLRDKFKTNLNINEGKLIKHAEKLETKKAIKDANVFLRKDLAELRSDIPQFKKDLIKYKSAIETGVEAKVSKEAQKSLKQHYEKAFDEVFKKPAEQNIKKVADKLEKAEAAAGVKKIPKSEFDKLNEVAKKKVKKKGSIVRGLAVGTIKEIIKAKTGLNIPTRGLGKFIGYGSAAGITYVTFFRNMYKGLKKQAIVRNFKKALATKNARTISNYRKKLREKGYTDTQINNLQKLAL